MEVVGSNPTAPTNFTKIACSGWRLARANASSDWHGSLGCYHDRQDCGGISNVPRDRYEGFRYHWMLFGNSLQTRTDIMELIHFVEDRFKKHEHTAFSKDEPKVGENFRWTGLGQRT